MKKPKSQKSEYNTLENQIQGLISTVAENNKGDFSLREEHSDFKMQERLVFHTFMTEYNGNKEEKQGLDWDRGDLGKLSKGKQVMMTS